MCKGKLKTLRDKDQDELGIQEVLMNQTVIDPTDGTRTIRYRCFDPEASSKIKPVKAIEKLLNQSTKAENLSKTAGPAGFGIRSPPIYDEINASFTKSNHLLDKIRRNQ